jgi:hypothetical protein
MSQQLFIVCKTSFYATLTLKIYLHDFIKVIFLDDEFFQVLGILAPDGVPMKRLLASVPVFAGEGVRPAVLPLTCIQY